MTFAVKAEKLTKSYNSEIALDNVSFDVSSGEIFGLIGADGSGKTTLIKILNTLLRYDSGKGQVCGYDIKADFQQIRRITGYMAGTFSLYGDLSVEENLRFFARVFNVTLNDNYDLIKDIYILLEPFKKRKAKDLSGGMKQKLALCCALIHKPKILFLDEPTTGVDPVSRQEFWENLKKISSENITTIVSTPYMDEAVMCDRVAFMQAGRMLKVSSPQEIITSYPNEMLKVKIMGNTRSVIGDLRSCSGIESVYSFGEYVHISCKKGKAGEIQRHIKDDYKNIITYASLEKPEIEDCFLYYSEGK